MYSGIERQLVAERDSGGLASLAKRLATPLLALAIFLLNAYLNAPLFMSGESPFRGSIVGGYISMARFISEHPNPWGWNPLPYCGLPTQFLYVPALLYLTAMLVHLLPHASVDSVYRVIVACAACLGPVTLFLFALFFTKNRRWSFVAALVYSLLSPSYLLFPAVDRDRGLAQLPWRIKVLEKYGEGPHNTGLTLLPLALLAVWLAGKTGDYPRILTAALLLALIPLTNWVAAMGLAISCMLLLMAAWDEPGFRVRRVLAAAGLAYLLACFWLTPSFVKTIAFNWPIDSYGYQLQAGQVGLLVGVMAGTLLLRVVFRWFRGSFYFCFVALGAFVFGWIAGAFYLYNVDTIPESHRYSLEFELFFALAMMEALRLTLRSSNQTVRLCAVGSSSVILLMGAPQIWDYVTEGWRSWTPAPKESTIEYKLAEWIAQHPPEGRVYAMGGLRFRLNSWFDLPQVGGSFDTGLSNRLLPHLDYRVRVAANVRPGRETEDTLRNVKALGAEYIVIHGRNSREYFRDFHQPERIARALPLVYHLEDDDIFALRPRPLAHLLRTEELPAADVLWNPGALDRYVAALDDDTRPRLAMKWTGASSFTVSGPVMEGQVISVQVNADRDWRAVQDGRPIAMDVDNLGFMTLHPTSAAQTVVQLNYHGTNEQRFMAVMSGVTWIAALLALQEPFRRRRRLQRNSKN
jgi:hypothetical protein